MSNTLGSLRDHFLISMPHLRDETFAQTVVYICDHSEYGAMGIMVNRPSGIRLCDLLSHLELEDNTGLWSERPVFNGGPVRDDRGFVLHLTEPHQTWLSSHAINDEISLTTSLDILEAIARGEGPSTFLVALGYAGWGPEQLEQEMCDNLWLSCQANSDILFHLPLEDRLQAAAATLGINLNLLPAHAGHA
jgi:putative transcriptional regulator